MEALNFPVLGIPPTIGTDRKISSRGTADISERECLRCFRKTIQLSPIQYLLKYRIMQGAEMLLRNPAWTISEVAALCGFDSPSNFAKLFKRFYNCAPREYRQREQCQTGYEKTGE